MSFADHLCEECDHWDAINGCWLDAQEGPIALDPGLTVACPQFSGDDYEDDHEDEEYPASAETPEEMNARIDAEDPAGKEGGA